MGGKPFDSLLTTRHTEAIEGLNGGFAPVPIGRLKFLKLQNERN